MLEQSKLWIEHLAGGVEIAAAVIIGLAAAEAVWKALPLFLRRGLRQDIKVEVRLSLGRWLALGLEFALAADILRTAVAPTWRDIGQLAAIAVLRTGLNYSLELDDRSRIIYTIIISSILYFQRNTTGAALISSKY
jgi:uncharacterized membrane protein